MCWQDTWRHGTTTRRRIHRRIKTFVENYKKKYGDDRVTADPIEAGYIAVYLWAAAVEKAGSTDVDKVKEAAKDLEWDAPEGKVTIDGDNQHIYKTVRIGEVQADGTVQGGVELRRTGEARSIS